MRDQPTHHPTPEPDTAPAPGDADHGIAHPGLVRHVGPEVLAILDEFLDQHGEELVSIRRQMHVNPEPSWGEHQTTSMLAQRLQIAGLEPRILPEGVGIVCDIGGGDGPWVALRGDLDALPLQDEKDVPYRSQVDGMAHACGHDVHATTVLGAGLALAELHRRLPDRLGDLRVRLILQPAEEAIPGGALSVIRQGEFEGVREVYSVHCYPQLDVGKVGVRTGPITSAYDQVRIRLFGPGGHTGRPHQTVDLVTVAAKVVTDLALGVSRLTDFRGGANLTFGSVRAGHAPNVIPSEALLEGTFRATDRSTWNTAPDLLKGLLEAVVVPYGAAFELEHHRGAPPVENDPSETALVAGVGGRLFGPHSVIEVDQSLGGEDFSWYLERARGSYIRLGVRTPGEEAHDLHAPLFDVDERAIPVGVRLLACIAIEASLREAEDAA